MSKLVVSILILILLMCSIFGVIIGIYFFNLFLKAKFNEFENKFYNLEIIISASLNFGI